MKSVGTWFIPPLVYIDMYGAWVPRWTTATLGLAPCCRPRRARRVRTEEGEEGEAAGEELCRREVKWSALPEGLVVADKPEQLDDALVGLLLFMRWPAPHGWQVGKITNKITTSTPCLYRNFNYRCTWSDGWTNLKLSLDEYCGGAEAAYRPHTTRGSSLRRLPLCERRGAAEPQPLPLQACMMLPIKLPMTPCYPYHALGVTAAECVGGTSVPTRLDISREMKFLEIS